MSWQEESKKGVGVCERCGSISAIWIRPDDSIYALTKGATCTCGGQEFRVLEWEDLEHTSREGVPKRGR